MPIYEYHCPRCNKDVSIFFLSFSEAEKEAAVCPECGDEGLERVFSTVSVIKGKQASTRAAQPSKNSANENAPAELADVMKKAASESGTEYGDDFKEVMSRLKKGESTTSIEKSLRKRVGESMQTH